MKAINLKDKINNYNERPDLSIPKAHLNSICQFKQKDQTCRYICLLSTGYICCKKTELKNYFDMLVKEGKMIALGDNCEGLGNEAQNFKEKS